jgi:hypothetical protein
MQQQLTTTIAKHSEQPDTSLLKRVLSSIVHLCSGLLASMLNEAITLSACDRSPVVKCW